MDGAQAPSVEETMTRFLIVLVWVPGQKARYIFDGPMKESGVFESEATSRAVRRLIRRLHGIYGKVNTYTKECSRLR